MNMMKVITSATFFASLFFLMAFNPQQPTNIYDKEKATIKKDTSKTTYKLLTNYSKILWTGSKIGGQHTGEISFNEGYFEFADTVLVDGKFEINMHSITNTDIADTAMAAKLVTHLKSEDFFNVKTYPRAIFRITKVIPYGKVGELQHKYKIVGKLTMNGITRTIKFVADLFIYDTGNISVTSIFSIDRSDFNIKYGSGTFFDDLKDKIIYDDILLELSLTGSIH